MRNYRPSPLDEAINDEEVAQPAQLALLPPDGGMPALPEEVKRGPGRPKDSKNRRDEEYAALLRARHGCPLEAATQMGALNLFDEATVIELARRWACSRLEAVDRILQSRRDVFPYHYKRQPQELQLSRGAGGGMVPAEILDNDGGEATDAEYSDVPGDAPEEGAVRLLPPGHNDDPAGEPGEAP